LKFLNSIAIIYQSLNTDSLTSICFSILKSVEKPTTLVISALPWLLLLLLLIYCCCFCCSCCFHFYCPVATCEWSPSSLFTLSKLIGLAVCNARRTRRYIAIALHLSRVCFSHLTGHRDNDKSAQIWSHCTECFLNLARHFDIT